MRKLRKVAKFVAAVVVTAVTAWLVALTTLDEEIFRG